MRIMLSAVGSTGLSSLIRSCNNKAAFVFCLLPLFPTLFYSADSAAQQVSVSGVCPYDLEIPSLIESEYFTIVGNPDLFVGANDDQLLDPLVSKQLMMHTGVIAVEQTEFRALIRTKRKLLLDDFICAWIDRDNILPRSVDSLTVGAPIEFKDPETGVTTEINNPLPLKALLRSNPEVDVSDATVVKIYDKPDTNSAVRTEASVFGIYLIYQQIILDDGIWFWIAGSVPDTSTKFSGWVPDDNVLLWESQLSLYFNEQSLGTDIFFSPDSAALQDEFGVLAARPVDFAERSIGTPDTDKPVTTNIARFPILKEQEEVESASGTSIYKIGFFGDSEIVEVSSQRGRIQKNVRKIDMLFVLDNTLSMTEYFPHVVQAVRNATETIKRVNESEGYDVEVKYAAAIYGDYLTDASTPDDAQFQILARLASPGYTEHLGRLTAIAEDVDYFRDSQSDTPEAGMAGIIRGIRELEWSSDTEFKVVVWIGDHGSRDLGDAENLTTDDVRQVLEDSSALLLPINVSGRYDEKWNTQFIRQGNAIASLRGLETKLAYSDTRGANYSVSAQLIEEAIANMYVSSLTASVAVREGTNIEETLTERRDLLELGIPAAEADVRKISEAICEIAFGIQGCQNVTGSGQFMTEGYVRYDEESSNYSFWVNLEFDQLELLSVVMKSTCRGFERSGVKKSIENAMVIVQNTMGGDTYSSDIPVGEYLRRYLFLPAQYFPSFLESTPDKIEEQWQAARDADTKNGDLEQTQKIADPICKSAYLMGMAFDNKRLIDIDSDLVRTSDLSDAASEYSWTAFSNDRLVDFNWEWSQGGENNYFYLPVMFLPSNVTVQ